MGQGLNFKKSNGPTVALIIILMMVFGLFILIDINLRPTILAIAKAKARLIATKAINDAIHNRVVDDVKYQDLIYIKTDNNGRIVLMQPNTIKINKIASETTLEVQKTLENLKDDYLKIPLGQVLGSQLIANHGPRIKVDIVPLGTVQTEVVDEFQEAGINQTRHLLYLHVKTTVKIIIPLVSSDVVVSTMVPVAETIIVGEVPQTYFSVNLDKKQTTRKRSFEP